MKFRSLASARIKSRIKSYFSLTLFHLHVLKKYFSKLEGLQASKLRPVCLDDVFSLPKSPPALEGRQTSQSERANKRSDFSLAAKCEIQSSLNE